MKRCSKSGKTLALIWPLTLSLMLPDPALIAADVSSALGPIRREPSLQSLISKGSGLPSELGTIEASRVFSNSPLSVILLQDAHASPDAQLSLYKSVLWLMREGGARHVALEGAEGPIDPGILRSFPDTAVLEQVLMSYVRAGEISGAAAASVFAPEDAVFTGIDDEVLYRDSVDAYLEGLSRGKDLLMLMRQLRTQLLSETKKTSKEMTAGVSILEGALPIGEQIEWINRALSPEWKLQLAEKFPEISRFIEGVNGLKTGVSDSIRSELRGFAEKILSADLDKSFLAEARSLKQSFETEEISPESFAEKMIALAASRNLNLCPSDELQKRLLTHIELENLLHGEFGSRWEAFKEAALDEVYKGSRDLWTAWKTWYLFQRWIRFELGPEQYSAYQRSETALSEPWKNAFAKVRLAAGKENPWDGFYRLALERDRVFGEWIEGFSSKKRGPALLLLSAGGFHTPGIEEKLNRLRISHARFIPSMSEVPDDGRYIDHMEGRFSWADVVRAEDGEADVYRGFQESAVHRILEHYQKDSFRGRAAFLEWREIYQRDRRDEPDDFARNWGLRLMDRSLYSLLSEEDQTAFRVQWQQRLRRFTDSLRQMPREEKALQESWSALTARSGAVAWPAVKSFAPRGSHVPESWLKGRPRRSNHGEKPREQAVRSELRSVPDESLERRKLLTLALSGFGVMAWFQFWMTQAQNADPAERGLSKKLDPNPLLSDPLFAEIFADTYRGLFRMRNERGLPFNQASRAETPATGWMKSADMGFLWSSDLAAALAHQDGNPRQGWQDMSPRAVTARTLESLKYFKTLVDEFGLRSRGINTGILPEVLILGRSSVKPEILAIPDRPGQSGAAYAAYDMALTHVRLKLLAEVFRGGYVEGLKNAQIVRLAESLLAQADYRPFLDSEGHLHSQVFQADGAPEVIFSKSKIDNRHSEARDFLLIAELFGDPRRDLSARRVQGLQALSRLRHQWTFAEGSDERAYPIGLGDATMSAWTEYEGLQFLEAESVSPEILGTSSKYYFEAARRQADQLGYLFAGTAPGTGVNPEIYEPYGLLMPEVTVPAGVFLALNSQQPAALENARKLILAAKREESYAAGWGLPDAVDPSSGKAFGTKRIFMNQALIVEALAAPYFRQIVKRWPDYREIEKEFRQFDVTHPAPKPVSRVSLFRTYRKTGFFTQNPNHPGNRETLDAGGVLRVRYQVDDKNAFSGFVLKTAGLELTPYRTLKLTFSEDSVLPETFKIELKGSRSGQAVQASLEVTQARPGRTLNLDLTALAQKVPQPDELLIVFERDKAGQNRAGSFQVNGAELTAELLPRPRSELRNLPDDPGIEWVLTGESRRMADEEEILAIVDGVSGETIPEQGRTKPEIHRDGYWHAVAHVYIFDSAGKLLLQERSSKKDISAGKLQVSASGHVNMGETRLQTILRETKEELGITLDSQRLQLISSETGYARSYEKENIKNREFVTVYLYRLTDEEKTAIHINYEEMDRAVFLPMAIFEQCLREFSESFSGTLNGLMTEQRDLYVKIKEASETRRSELRQFKELYGDQILSALAESRAMGPEASAWLKRVLSGPSAEPVIRELNRMGQDPAYARLRARASETARFQVRNDPASESVEAVPEIYFQDLLGRKKINRSPTQKLQFTFAYRLPASQAVRENLYRYLRSLSALQGQNPDRVSADVMILLHPKDRADPAAELLIRKIARLGVAKFAEISQSGIRSSLPAFLARHPGALVYGLGEAGEWVEGHSSRIVRSEAEADSVFPVVLLLTRVIAEQGAVRVNAEKLKQWSELLPGILRLVGGQLKVQTLHDEISRRAEAELMTQSYA